MKKKLTRTTLATDYVEDKDDISNLPMYEMAELLWSIIVDLRLLRDAMDDNNIRAITKTKGEW